MKFASLLLICVALQLLLFVPFYIEWRKDCKKYGKENLAVSLRERFEAWLLVCPIWVIPIYCWRGGEG